MTAPFCSSRGPAVAAGSRGMPTADAIKLTGHKKIETFMSYYQAGNVLKSKSGRMLEDEESE